MESVGDRPLYQLYRSSGCQQKPATCYRFAACYPVWHLDSRRINVVVSFGVPSGVPFLPFVLFCCLPFFLFLSSPPSVVPSASILQSFFSFRPFFLQSFLQLQYFLSSVLSSASILRSFFFSPFFHQSFLPSVLPDFTPSFNTFSLQSFRPSVLPSFGPFFSFSISVLFFSSPLVFPSFRPSFLLSFLRLQYFRLSFLQSFLPSVVPSFFPSTVPSFLPSFL